MDKIDYSIEENQIEKEDEGNVAITMPFNPNMIKIRRDPFTISELVDKMEHGEIRFDTPFQRKSDLWDEEKQSRLIESLLLKLPLPAFYFDETETDEDAEVWNVIDGLQRCSVFKHFIVEKTMRLHHLEFLTQQYDGMTFNELPRLMQRRITQTPIIMDEMAPSFYTEQEKEVVGRLFPTCEKISIDYAVMEKSKEIYTLPAEFGWSDLGSWGSLRTLLPQDEAGNAKVGKDIRLYECKNCVVHAADESKVVVQGLDGYIVAEKHGQLLVCSLKEEQRIKEFGK